MIEQVSSLEERFRSTYLSYWKDIHTYPELSDQEFRTAEKIATVLRSLGLEVRTGVGTTGVVGLLRGSQNGPTIGLRADMDALSIEEKTGVPFASKNPGIMHACGHDSHTAMLLGAAHILSELKGSIKGFIKFIFQPAEENSPTGGAPGMIRDGVLENPAIDYMIGIHVWPTLKTGTIGVREGAMSAASDRLHITIKGRSAHASTPQRGIDAIVASAQVINALQSIISRNVSPLDQAVITIGTIQGGSRYNIIPEEVFLDGTVRTFDPGTRGKMPEWITRAAKGTAEALGAEAIVDYKFGYPSLMNNVELVNKAKEVIREIVGKRGLIDIKMPDLGGEDFAFFSEKVPAVFAWIGCCPREEACEKYPMLHNNRFIPDESALPYGVKYLVLSTLKLMEMEKR